MTKLQLVCLFAVVAVALPLAALVRGGLAPLPATAAVVDDVDLLSEREQASVARYHERLLADHDIDYRVVVARAGAAIAQTSHDAFATLAVGERSGRGRGLLLWIDPGTNQVRVEVAAALEGVFTDAFVAYLEQRQMVPFFAVGRIADGILATTELIFARAQDAAAGDAFDPGAAASFSLGGGATAAARIGAGAEHSWAQDRGQVSAQATPEATVAAYLAAMAARNGRPDLAIYSRESQALLRSWTLTAAQMDSVARTYRACGSAEIRYGDRGDLAVVRYGVRKRQCAPWFLRREGGRWTLDLLAGQQAIRFNHRNQWRFPDPDGHRYAFAFADWRFDRHGFPLAPD